MSNIIEWGYAVAFVDRSYPFVATTVCSSRAKAIASFVCNWQSYIQRDLGEEPQRITLNQFETNSDLRRKYWAFMRSSANSMGGGSPKTGRVKIEWFVE